MKAIKYLIFILSVVILSSCLDQTTNWDDNATGLNLAGFESTTSALNFVSDGNEYIFTFRMKLTGPTSKEVKNPITVTVGVDQDAMDAIAAANPTKIAAVEGENYRLDQTEIVLDPNNNFLNLFPVTVLTASNAGITDPLDKTPVLVLKVTQVTGDPSVTNHGKSNVIDLNYGCDSNLDGSYTVDISINNGAATRHYTDEYITKTGVGQYRTTYVGHWLPASLGGVPGFTFYDVCGDLTIPEQNLVDTYGNLVFGSSTGSADPVTGELKMSYEITFSEPPNNTYDCVYTRN
jgi:hypothetical protein